MQCPQALIDALRVWDFAPEHLSAVGTTDDASSELLSRALPAIRADLSMREAFCAAAATAKRAGQPACSVLPAPVHVFGGAPFASFNAGTPWTPMDPDGRN